MSTTAFAPTVAAETTTDIDFSDFCVAEAAEWISAGFTAVTALDWFRVGFTVTEAVDWTDEGFTLDTALDWDESGFTAAEATDWRLDGWTLDEAADLTAAGVTRVEALDWVGADDNVASIVRCIRAGVAPTNGEAFARFATKGRYDDED